MNQLYNNDTIVAIATAQVEGAISILRLSGNDAIALADKLYRGKEQLANVASHTINYGKIVNPKTKLPLDEVLVSVFRAPRTYTREDVIEINCHGGVEITNEILFLCLQQGARLAEPGEFTKRAFLNGRIDLTQAEAVADMITAENERAVRLAIDTIDGKLSQQIQAFRQQVVEILANIEVNIDYPEYDDVIELTDTILLPMISKLQDDIQKLLQTANTGQVIKNGVKTAIIGRPNVGKSSLLNVLLREQKAIVTDIAGTTRDIVEGTIKLNNITLNMIDTAGIRSTDDIVEQIGVTKAKEVLELAEVVLLVLDSSSPLTTEDIELLDLVQTKKHVLVLNKKDLATQLELPEKYQTDTPVVAISALEDLGIETLYDALENLLAVDLTTTNQVFLSNTRHISLLHDAVHALEQAKETASIGMPIDIITIDLQNCYQKLGEVLGLEVQDELLDTLFSQFCLGK